ncbi:MAG: lytic transglycosylase domain-containing protein [Desulfobulbus sp.]|uniref:transglycosylase SLT domain-containing protein n=1 Tax=Desulfobulbus sp. TaxID=895 RepID=UPI00283BF8BA|nr:transglycosylase SLT domain-containing protein [Desulfobulbus sp.]MDR2550367.1 lytic transglycosylase domain-containing protein [Desulfobulbus sp.]
MSTPPAQHETPPPPVEGSPTAPSKRRKTPGKKRSRPANGKAGRKRRGKKPAISTKRLVAWTSLEILGLAVATLTGIVVLLGYAAAKFSGTGFFSHLLPFTLGVLGLILTGALLLIGWMRLRSWLQQKKMFLPALIALALALVAGIMTLRGDFFFAFNQFRILVGGKEEAGRATLAHQVFAAYRRLDTAQLRQLIDRAKPFDREIDAAASAFGLDPDLLHGIAAAESSFLPRDSKDGGQGLFQITQIPESAMQAAADRLKVAKPQPDDHRHNGYLAAATLTHYLAQMRGDLFLGLLAYNIGPKNGGLRFIMQQYGATDFVTVQPYLQQLPRDYPIRVLCYALAFRLSRTLGALPAYEEGLNAVRIQQVGIPGL